MWERELEVAVRAARAAGTIVREFYERGVEVGYKDAAQDKLVTEIKPALHADCSPSKSQ